mgnify:CR=1 FL=1
MRTTPDYSRAAIDGMANAIERRLNPRVPMTPEGAVYRSMSLLEIGREFLELRGVSTRGMDRFQLSARLLGIEVRSGGMQGTSDFSSLLANVANKRLRAIYDENPGTYAMWARRAPNAPDFREMTVTQLSGAPDLLRTSEHGEFKYGTLMDAGEKYAVVTYGRIVPLTRQAMINDDLRGFDRLVSAFAASARRLENRLVYSRLTANAAMADGVPLFHATRGNLGAGAGSALQFNALSAGRKAMRLQKGLQGEELNLTPSYLIVPAALEQTAYQLTSAGYTPAAQSEINEFRQGGRSSLTPVVEPLLDASSATAWYLAASGSQVDTVEYCYLDGADGPVIESHTDFGTDGVSFKCRLDFAAKDIDFRGLYRSDGA